MFDGCFRIPSKKAEPIYILTMPWEGWCSCLTELFLVCCFDARDFFWCGHISVLTWGHFFSPNLLWIFLKVPQSHSAVSVSCPAPRFHSLNILPYLLVSAQFWGRLGMETGQSSELAKVKWRSWTPYPLYPVSSSPATQIFQNCFQVR